MNAPQRAPGDLAADPTPHTNPRHLIALFGATASGKTAVAVDLAARLPIEVVSADSRQVRRGMRIGTAAPTPEEQAAVPHHLVAIVEPDAPWTVAEWLDRARAVLERIWARGAVPLLVAGTGHYAWSLLEGRSIPRVAPNPRLRETLEEIVATQGASALHARLAWLDPASAARIDTANARRVIRALEIIDATGGPVPPLRNEPPDFTWNAVGLRWPREQLYARADARAETMYDYGLIEETRALVRAHGDAFDALRSIGYTEALRVLTGEWTRDEALARTQTSTHRLIRMQGTWFRDDDPRIAWTDARDPAAVRAAVEGAATPPVR
ncbi:MAG: tRNA (adenosine(37)-N6)-dimethylallyltransferase MiaA [Chloroflexi bacterium]|nr:tRNA (adenosine(37)-N6)-dimethylallyltransferase MiaA [Chloroflexota bacterium]